MSAPISLGAWLTNRFDLDDDLDDIDEDEDEDDEGGWRDPDEDGDEQDSDVDDEDDEEPETWQVRISALASLCVLRKGYRYVRIP